MECKACGVWYVSGDKSGVCPTCKRTLKNMGIDISYDHLQKLVEADRDGRCGIPPVKLHQTIYRVFDGKIIEETVCKAIWEPFMPNPRWKIWVMGGGLPYYWNDCIGKTVFLTREAAEAALKGDNNA